MNSAHWHLALNHIPVIGSFFVLGLLVWALWRRSEELKRVSLGATVLLALLTIPAYMTGEPAFEAAMEVLEATPEDEDPIVKAHETAAGVAFGGVGLTGVVALAGLLYSRGGRKPVPSWAAVAVLVLLAITAALMVRAANLGGTIRHPEIRSGPAPTAFLRSGLLEDRAAARELSLWDAIAGTTPGRPRFRGNEPGV